MVLSSSFLEGVTFVSTYFTSVRCLLICGNFEAIENK